MSAKKTSAVWHSRLSPTSFPKETMKKCPAKGDFSKKTATCRLKLLPVDIKKMLASIYMPQVYAITL